jgi:hypothetical protein
VAGYGVGGFGRWFHIQISALVCGGCDIDWLSIVKLCKWPDSARLCFLSTACASPLLLTMAAN